MIFYFTGTGNSLYVAKKIAKEHEQVISIIDALRNAQFSYTLKKGEPLGFVFPVYFYTVSDPVLDFIRKLKVDDPEFVYAIIPCGASIGSAGGFLKEELKKRGLELQRVDPLVVPDGALLFYDIDSPEAMASQLEAATKELAFIREAIQLRKSNNIKGSAVAGKAMLAAYHACMSTKKFFAEDSCIHCGMCAQNCPSQAITLISGKPVWTKTKCYKCCGCINRCPAGAIQYGRKTSGRGRYVNPVLR